MVQSQILNLEQQLAEKKRMVNGLCALIGRSHVYANTEPTAVSVGIRSDEFYGKPLASAVRSILEKRAAAGLGAATLDEIFDGMQQGGYRFDAKNDGTARRALSISLAKNTVTFHKLPNGNIGLTEWYPEAKPRNGKDEKDKGDGDKEHDGLGQDQHDEDGPYPNDFAETSKDEKPSRKKRMLFKVLAGTHTQPGPDGKDHTFRVGDPPFESPDDLVALYNQPGSEKFERVK
jgi:hypothetical protein